MSARNVIIVDDSLTVRMDLSGALSAAGFAVQLCATAAEAREAVSRGTPDAIVLDVLLPDGDGVELLEEIRSLPHAASVPVVMLSTEAEVKDRIRGLKRGADEYVGKPYDAAYLIAKLDDLARARTTGGRPTLLVIDDSVTFRSALREALTGAGYDVVEAASGEDGLRIAGAQRPDAIVVDGVLPGMDGPTLIRRVRLDAALRDVPCLLLTGSEGRHAELRALDAGADAFVRKEEHLDVVIARVGAMLRSAAGPAPGAAKSLAGLRRILAVDDSATYLNALVDAFKDEGYDVVPAHSGEEALELLSVQRVDCILLDLMMPGLSGNETCERIKASPVVRDIPLIMLTALEDRDTMLRGLASGADDFISKSSEFEVLKARVRAQIRRKQFEDENRRIREELLGKELEAAEAQAARELAEARARLVDELERKNQELEAFSYSVSHDLRSPLRAVQGFTRRVLDSCGDALDDRSRDYLQRVVAAAERMSRLTNDLLELSKVGRADLRRQPIDLADIVRHVVGDLRKRSDREVDVIIADRLPADADPGLMQIAFENLIGNSWKFTAKAARPRIEIGCLADGRTCFLRDNGAGFDMAYAARLFKPFSRLHSESEFAGTGVGLATVHRIIERHGGRIWAEGAPGEGAAFYFTLSTEQVTS